MGSDNGGLGKPNSRGLLAAVFTAGIFFGVILTFTASSMLVDDEGAGAGPGRGRTGETASSTTHGISESARVPEHAPGGFWIETIQDATASHPSQSRLFILHNVLTAREAEHIKSLGVIKGMEKALIIPYGEKDLVESTTRTNTAAWLDFAQDPIVMKLEALLADVTGTTPEHGENLQVLRYQSTQTFAEHHDYFDPDLDPPENFLPGGNRLATVLVYLQNAGEGGETFFPKLGLKLKPEAGDALLFYDLLPNGRIDKMSVHTGTPPSEGEKWVATKWIHEKVYQGKDAPDRSGKYR